MYYLCIANNKIVGTNIVSYQEKGVYYPIIKIEVSDEIYQAYLEDIRKVIYQDGQVVFNPEYEEIKANERRTEFESKFLLTSKGNYRLQPKGYSNAQQSIDTINGMVNAIGSLNERIARMVIFYPTPDFKNAEECTEEWLIAHQHNIEPMTKEEWLDFYIEFSELYALNQYKSNGETP